MRQRENERENKENKKMCSQRSCLVSMVIKLAACGCGELVWVQLRVSCCQIDIPQVSVFGTCGEISFGTKP